MLQLYDRLLKFALFQGMSRDDLAHVAGHTKFGFLKVEAGQLLLSSGEACTQLYFLITGSLRVLTAAIDSAYRVEEQLDAPYVLQPEAIVGYNQCYTHSFDTITDCSFITLEKSEVMRLCQEFLVFRINLLGMFATQAQRLLQQPWQSPPSTLQERIMRFFIRHCLQPSGSKEFHILMARLADEVGDSRLDVSRALNLLQRDGLVVLHRGRISVPRMELLNSAMIEKS